MMIGVILANHETETERRVDSGELKKGRKKRKRKQLCSTVGASTHQDARSR